MNYLTQRAHDDVFLRLSRRCYLSAWASAALAARDAATRYVLQPSPFRIVGSGRRMIWFHRHRTRACTKHIVFIMFWCMKYAAW